MKHISLALILVGIALPLPAVVAYASEFIAVDRCLDGGGSYDYSRGECDQQRNHPYVPFASRHPQLVSTFPTLALAGCGLVAVGGVLRRRGRGVVA
jgi:hypothetical protein